MGAEAAAAVAGASFKRAVIRISGDTDGEHESLDFPQMRFRWIIAFGVVYNAARVSSERSRELASSGPRFHSR